MYYIKLTKVNMFKNPFKKKPKPPPLERSDSKMLGNGDFIHGANESTYDYLNRMKQEEQIQKQNKEAAEYDNKNQKARDEFHKNIDELTKRINEIRRNKTGGKKKSRKQKKSKRANKKRRSTRRK